MYPTLGEQAGFGDERVASESVIVWGRDSDIIKVNQSTIGAAAVDAGNSPTTTLRAGLVLGRKTSDGLLYQWNPTATDGTQFYAGVLQHSISTLNSSHIAANHNGFVIYRAPFKASQLLIGGTAFASSASREWLRHQMLLAGCLIDDELLARSGFLGLPAAEEAKTADYQILAADNGKLFTNLAAAGAVVFTLPPVQPGLSFEFLVRTAQSTTVQKGGSDTHVGGNLASNAVGSGAIVYANAAGNAWYSRVFKPWAVT